MGSSVMSALQGIGQTGNEIGTGAINAQQQSHQFLMDYLARQAQTRQLNLEQSGQEQAGRIATGQQDIEKQRLQQSRWQLMPGYTKIPHPDNPSQTLYRHTFMDPITKQQTFYDADQPPPGSPEYIMNSFNYLTKQAKDLNLDIPISARLNAAGMKVDTEVDKNLKYRAYWDQMQAAAKDDPAAMAMIKKSYPGGFADYLDKNVKDTEAGFSKQQQIDFMRDLVASGKTTTGASVIPQADNALIKSLTQSQTAYEKQLADSMKDIHDLGMMGEVFNTAPYQAAVKSRDDAITKLSEVKGRLADVNARVSGPQATQPLPPPPTHINPPVPHPADGQTATGPNGHKIIVKGGQWVDAITGQPIGSSQ